MPSPCPSPRRRDASWLTDTRGSIALLGAFALLAIVLCVGLAIDGARAYYTASKTTTVLDAAALAAAKSMSERDLTDEEVRDVVARFIAAHMSVETERGITSLPADVTIDRANDTVSVTMTAHVTTYIATLAGIPRFEVSRGSAATFGQKNIELGMMLDVSGSMNDFDKIGTLRSAARTLVERLMPETPDARRSVRIGMAPYSTAVNIDRFANLVKETPGMGRPEDRCVTERVGAVGVTEASPASALFPNRATECPGNSVVAITDDRASLFREIDALSAGGYTAGHLGIAWAWYLVSPQWAGIWPSESQPVAYTERRTIKAVILMTDGMFNTQYEADNGSSAQQAATLCANIKAAGVVVYTIGYEAPPEVLPLLRNCASSSSLFFDAGNATELMGAFEKIAAHLTELRLTR